MTQNKISRKGVTQTKFVNSARKLRGVPKGYKHHWKYTGRWNETKTGPGTWKFQFKATKKTKAKGMGPKPGYKVHWKIQADQYAVKTRKGTYQTNMLGTKKLVR